MRRTHRKSQCKTKTHRMTMYGSTIKTEAGDAQTPPQITTQNDSLKNKSINDGKVYYQSPEAPSETVLTSGTEQGAYVIEPGWFEATKTVISFLVLPRRTKLQGGPPREAVSERDIILNEGGESVTFRSLSGKFLPRDGEKLQQLWMDLDTAVRPV